MAQWKRIVCATDLTEASRRVLGEAAGLAQHFGAELLLVHVHARVEPARVAGDALAFTSEELTRQEAQKLQPTLETWTKDAERLLGRPVEARLLAGEPARELVHVAEVAGSDLIVVGTHGRTGVKRALLGSVAEWVVRHAPCSVLVVRERPWDD